MKKVFDYNDDFNKTAFLNWRTQKNDPIHNFMVLGEGYLSSAIELVKLCLADNDDKKADMLIFPILHNANHGIELYLKALIKTIDILSRSKESKLDKHDLSDLFDKARIKIENYNDLDGFNHFYSENISLKEYLDELLPLIQITPDFVNTDFARFPETLKKHNPFYIDKLSNVVIDLEYFVERFEFILRGLKETVEYYNYDELENMHNSTN